MTDSPLQSSSFQDQLSKVESDIGWFYFTDDMNNLMAVISLVCFITYTKKAKGEVVDCYDVLRKICNNLPDSMDTCLRSFGMLCELCMRNMNKFPTFNIPNNEMVPTIKKYLQNLMPF